MRPDDAPDAVEPVTTWPGATRWRDLPLVPLSVTLSKVPIAATESVSMRLFDSTAVAAWPMLIEHGAEEFVVTSTTALVTMTATGQLLVEVKMPAAASLAVSGIFTVLPPP